MHVFNEPFEDTGYDHDANPATPAIGAGNGKFDFDDADGDGQHDVGEASEGYEDISDDNMRNTVLGTRADATDYVREQVERATIAWAQAGIRVERAGGINFEDPPDFPAGHASAGQQIFSDDADFDIGAGNDEEVIINNTGGVSVDVAEVFFVPRCAGSTGYARVPANTNGLLTLPAAQRENTYLFVINADEPHPAPPSASSPPDFRRRTLAHELGHGFLNRPDVSNPDYIYFPADSTVNDVDVESRRRIQHATENYARTLRAAGAFTDVGNRLLRPGN